MTNEEAIKLLLESKDNDIERSIREWEEWDKKYFEAIDVAIEALKQNQWIPCNERLPKKNSWYQCTVIINALPLIMELFYKNGKWLDNRRIGMFEAYDIYGYGHTKEKHKLSYQELNSEFDWTEEVIAWMPLSKPYERKQNEI